MLHFRNVDVNGDLGVLEYWGFELHCGFLQLVTGHLLCYLVCYY